MLSYFCPRENEKPLDYPALNGGFCRIFRTVACIGDSLSSGEFEHYNSDGNKQYYDAYEHSWGQYMARTCGSKVYNFSRGGMTAVEYCTSFADARGFWDPALASQAYILALGVNDILNQHKEPGTPADIDLSDWRRNAPTFAGYYGQIIQRYQEISPKAKFFLMTIPKSRQEQWKDIDAHAELLEELTKIFPNTYLIDLRKYTPIYDEDFCQKFFMGGHMNPMGYIYTAEMVMSYIDYIIRHNMADFSETGLIGTPYVYKK